MRIHLVMLIVLVMSLSTVAQNVPVSTRGVGDGSSRQLRVDNCMVKLIDNVRVPAEVEGILTELNASEGMSVRAGDTIAVIDDTRALLMLDLKQAEEREAELNALNDVNYRDAVNTERSAKAEAEAYKELRREGATPYWEMEKKILEAERATLRIEVAELQQKVAKVQYVAKRAERLLAENEVSRRQITAKFGGYIENRIAQLGEWVQPGSPVVQLVRLDKLRVEGDVDAFQYPGAVTRGTPVEILIFAHSDRHGADPANAIRLDATVDFVSSEIDLNNRYRVFVDIDNRLHGDDWLIKPGMEADMTILPK